jgi:site-specific recombinase XerD
LGTPATINRRIAAMSSFFDYAVSEEIIESNPAAKVKRPLVSNAPTNYLSDAQLKAFISTAFEASPRDHAAAWLLGNGGMRVSELIGAQIQDLVEIRGHRVLVVTVKGNRQREIPLAPPAWDAIQSAIWDRTEGTILLTESGEPMNRCQADRMVRRLARAAGIEMKISPHTLRHSAATSMLAAKADIRSVQKALGHASPSTTERYLHLLTDLDASP